MSDVSPTNPNPPDAYMSLTHIGWDWDVSNRILGKELERAGYWYYGTPTRKALDEGLAVAKKGSGYSWSREAVGRFIVQCGCSERSKPKVPRRLVVIPIIIE